MLIPTADRPSALAPTLTALLAQREAELRIVVADQSPVPVVQQAPEVATAVAALRRNGVRVELVHRPERRGIAEQRDWLLAQAQAPAVLFLDDDVLLEPGAVGRMLDALRTLGCGLVGMPVLGMSAVDDERPEDWAPLELWDEQGVHPERVRKGDPAWERWRLHNAATPLHLERMVEVPERGWVAYKVAWIGGCVLYDTGVLRAAGGYAFWRDLPGNLRGEDVVAQLRVLEARGGAGLLPSGAYHLELPTTLADRRVDAYAALLEGQALDGAAGV
ncbi:glycosyltransferase family 2 protein [Motilibacter rhizosphaerae]|uniref:glycosyltransferase family 2 protein n=1 Tax=Motilibacter rhizosphaerae TaxID=598652 RepID=UPI001E5ADC5C|nr:glycosyltransferase family 2 protein [Motilibacter rhizosphaerae]